MAVYVDDAYLPFRGMTMCHLIADTPQELRAFARRLGLKPAWVQRPGTRWEHFDVGMGMRAQAIKLGAIPVTRKELAGKLGDRPNTGGAS